NIDSRPSDAIAIALRTGAPIYASAEVLAKSKSLPTPALRTEPLQAKLGIQAQDLTPELAKLLHLSFQKGVLVADVADGSPAMSAGLQRGDVITRADQKRIESTKDLEALIEATKPPAKIELEVIKKGKPTLLMMDLPS
ncbi:MAG TPA: bifunctional nuclease domain-containing protein, partial [Terriglobales bacterium]|nr:bifunctional nuclease domain-containing protein [Terriglobales bacterium]